MRWTLLGIRVGLNKGYETTPIPKKVKPSHLKGRLSKKTQFVRSVVREVVGFAPYERRVLELLRNSKVCILPYGRSRLARSHRVYLVQDKKARKLTKKRVLHFTPPPSYLSTPCIAWTLIELFFPRRYLARHPSPFKTQAGGTFGYHPGEQEGGSLNESTPRAPLTMPVCVFVYHEIIASLCMHSSSSPPIRQPFRTSRFLSSL